MFEAIYSLPFFNVIQLLGLWVSQFRTYLTVYLSGSSILSPNFHAIAQAGEWQQCGGQRWSGASSCISGWTCTFSNEYYSQCLPLGTITGSATRPSATPMQAGIPTAGPSTQTGRLPALGWNHWNAYKCNITEAKVLAAASAFTSLGLKDAGYEYINIDDCWSLKTRDSKTGQIVPDPAKFPNGISHVASQVHALGLKIGIYSDAGTTTCAGYPASLGREDLDAKTFASWGIDYLKYDNCNVPGNWSDTENPPGGYWYNSNTAIRYRQMGAALAKQSRPIQYDLCLWGLANVWTWGARVGHSWRMSFDSSSTWSYIADIMSINVAHLSAVDFFSHNDMDMMEIGNGALSIQEQRTHFAAWVFMKSPILLGTNLDNLSTEQVSVVTNGELLAFHQDSQFGKPAMPFNASSSMQTTSPPEYYAGQSTKGFHVFITNTHSSTATKIFNFANVPGLGNGTFKLHDMWTGQDVSGTFFSSSIYPVNVTAHDTVAYLITKV
ncbi:glycoside hydrolase [Dendrothele bispora CBS 962.96]|uniref:Alpha-galactosidase n=1 Tax=Dendrothele bispora (strain CBS 962.96) TaxID=1314807 RepID=A0A4S8M0D6_DENBC|nr:glycoside hydrolase [Dendrothele bispora CBS 962.96]